MTDDAKIRIAAFTGRVRVLFEGHEVADSRDVLTLSETGHADVFYFPRQDVEMAALGHSERRTACPWKGEAAYFSILRDGRLVENIAWSYEQPVEGAELIAGRIAFYPQYVEFEADGTSDEPRHVPAHDPPYAD